MEEAVFIWYATLSDIFWGLFWAIVFGTISQKIKIIKVVSNIEIVTPLSPHICVARAEETEENTITAMLVPIKTTLKNLSGSLIKLDTIIAFLSPFLAKYFRCGLLEEITAVSTPEKKAAISKHINNIKGLILIHHSVKIFIPPACLCLKYRF